jgi:phosphatidylglycerophosphate synthase
MAGATPQEKGVSGSDGPVSRYLNRPISARISPVVAPWPVTPDQWTYVSYGLVCAGGAAFAVGAPRLGAAMVHAGSVLDGVDGEVARLQGTASTEGALLDVALDRVSDMALLGGLALGAGGRKLDWLLALGAANGIVTASVVKERIGAEGLNVAQLQREEAADGAVGALLPYTNRDGRLFAVTLCGLLRQPRLALLWLAVTSNLRLFRRLGAAREMLRRRSDG